MSDPTKPAPKTAHERRRGAQTIYAPPADEVPPSSRGTSPPVLVPSRTGLAAILEEIRRRPGDRLVVEERAASGGMGAIDVAVDRALDRRIALKTLHPHLRSDDASVGMFLREARLTGLLEHPNIVPVYDIGEHRNDLYFAMKLVEGQTLAAQIRARPAGPLDGAALYATLDVVVKVADALSFAHSRGVLHCDVKPANVMVGDYGQVYLMDWGIARLVTAASVEAASRARPGASGTDYAVIGTPCYMSPEQARGDRATLDRRSDVFLLGATLYETLVGRPPYPAIDRTDAIRMATAGAFPHPRTVEPTLPSDLERIVLRAMAKDPADRYPTVSALHDDLVRFMRGAGNFPRRTFAAGETIIREGETGDAAFIIVRGACDILRGTETVRTLGPGDVFGEMAILSPGPRTASAIATAETTLLVVTGPALEEEMAALKPWVSTLLKSLAERFRDVDTRHRASQHPPPVSSARLANQIFMHAVTWGNERPGGGRTIRWSELLHALEVQLGSPGLDLVEVLETYGFAVDVDADRLTIEDVPAVAAKLRAAL